MDEKITNDIPGDLEHEERNCHTTTGNLDESVLVITRIPYAYRRRRLLILLLDNLVDNLDECVCRELLGNLRCLQICRDCRGKNSETY